jgi:hypothetical protein
LIAQDRCSIDCFSRQLQGHWVLASCQALDGKILLEAIECDLGADDVYDKVVFAT